MGTHHYLLRENVNQKRRNRQRLVRTTRARKKGKRALKFRSFPSPFGRGGAINRRPLPWREACRRRAPETGKNQDGAPARVSFGRERRPRSHNRNILVNTDRRARAISGTVTERRCTRPTAAACTADRRPRPVIFHVTVYRAPSRHEYRSSCNRVGERPSTRTTAQVPHNQVSPERVYSPRIVVLSVGNHPRSRE